MTNFELFKLADSIHRKLCPDDYDSNGKILSDIDFVRIRYNFILFRLHDIIHRILDNPDDPFEDI